MMELATLAAKATLILLAAAAAAVLTRKRRAALRHWVWTVALIGVLTLPLARIVLPDLALLPSIKSADSAETPTAGMDGPRSARQAPGLRAKGSATANMGAVNSHGIRSLNGEANDTSRQAKPQVVGQFANQTGSLVGEQELEKDSPLSFWLLLAWLTGTLLTLGLLAKERASLRRLKAQASEWNPEALGDALQHLDVKRPVSLLLSESLEIPLTTGTARPLILLPLQAKQWPRERLRTVLLHEAAHIARRDHLWNLAGAWASALYWFNPLAWWALGRMRLESDRACDDLVLESGVDALRYADELLHFARGLPSRRLTIPALADRAGLRTRLRSILDASRERGRPRMASLAVLLTLAGLLLLPLSALTQRESSAQSGQPRGSDSQSMAEPASLSPNGNEAREGRTPVPPPLTLQQALGQLRDDDSAQRRRAAWMLGEKEDPRAVPTLIKALEDQHPEVRAMAAWALGEIKDRSCLPALAALAGDAQTRVREMAALALGELETTRALPHLTQLAADPDPGVRSAAIWGLGETGGAQARKGILRALGDSSPEVRMHAAQILGQKRLDEPGALLAALTDSSPRVRSQSAESLGLLRASSAVPALSRSLADPDPDVRRAAATALGRIGKSSALDALLAALDDPDLEVREQAVWALDEIRSE